MPSSWLFPPAAVAVPGVGVGRGRHPGRCRPSARAAIGGDAIADVAGADRGKAATAWARGRDLCTCTSDQALPAPRRRTPDQAFTLGRFLENTLNPDDPAPNPEPTGALEPRRLQFEAADTIADHAAAGGRLFLLADEPGVGKTISAVLGATAVGDLRGARQVLVVADRPAAITIGHWCRTITALGDGGLDWVVIAWDRLDKVTDHTWDVIIADEAHALRRTTTKRWKLWARISARRRPTTRRRSSSPPRRRLGTPRSSCPTWPRPTPRCWASR